MRRATDDARDHHDAWPGRRYSTRNLTALPVLPLTVVVGTSAPLIWIGSLAGPNAMQIFVLGSVRGTRLTGTVTVSSIPQPASRSPWVMTSGPDSAFSVTRGPSF